MNCSLGAVLGFTAGCGESARCGAVDEQEHYNTLDCLVGQQGRIENTLARRHLKNGTLVLYDDYDVTSTYF